VHTVHPEVTKRRQIVYRSTNFFCLGIAGRLSQQRPAARSLLIFSGFQRFGPGECGVGTIIAIATEVMIVFETIPATGGVQLFRLARNSWHYQHTVLPGEWNE
jgi:hypothetical protein